VPNLFYYGTDSGGILGWHDLGAMFSTTLTGVMSIAGGGSIGVSSTFKLVNDQTTPPGSYYYGTSPTGVRGWYALPSGGGGVPPTLQINTIDSLTGGGDLSANRTLSLVGDSATPSASCYYGTDAGGVRGFFSLPSGGGGVLPTVQINTAGSLTGGGDLSQNRTHTLVNDSATPGNLYYYGTDASGAKGFYALPSLAGYVPTSRRINTVNSLAGGATLGADITIQLQGDQVTPPASNYYGTDVNGNRGFFPLTGGVPPTRTIATQMSLTGGGDLTANRTLTLVGDVASPAVSNYYGTNAAGVRGWYAISALAGKNAFTTSAVVFTVPPVGQTVDVTLTDASWVAIGQMVAVQTAGGSPTAAGSLQCTNKVGNVVTLLNAPAASAVDEIGTVKGWAGTIKIPMTWLACDGSAVSRAMYPDLYALIGTSYGPGDGSTTFALPDFRGRVVLGAGQGTGLTARAIGATGGEENHQLTVAELAAHTHTYYNANTSGASIGQGSPTLGLVSSGTGSAGGNTPHNNMQPYGVALWIIKVSGGGGATAQAPIADTTQNGLLRKVSGLNTDYVDGTNNSRPMGPVIVGAPAGTPAPPGSILIPSLAQSPDGVWTPQTAFDDHFEGTVLDPKWTRVTTAGSLFSFEEVAGSWYTLAISAANAAGPYDNLITQPLPNSAPFELILRVRHRSCPGTNTAANTSFATTRFYLWNGTSGVDMRMGASFVQTGSTYLAAIWNYYGSNFASVSSFAINGSFEYLKIKYLAGGSVNMMVSSNGITFYDLLGTALTGAQTGFATTPPNSVGIGHRNIFASRCLTQIDWVRFVNT
jgi:microcystin-dependent protein